MKTALLVACGLILAVAALWGFGPREPFDRSAAFDEATLPADLDAYLAAEEARVPDVIPGAGKEIVWAGAPGERTPLSIVYLHGFSASKQEIRPVPDRLAAALGANLYYARFEGHGATGEALGAATTAGWWRDTAEALAIGRRIGRKVIVIGTSTGATLATIALSDPEVSANVAGFVGVSPNYEIKGAPLALMTMPFARQVLPLLLGDERSWEPMNAEHGKWWTTRYPLVAILPLGAAVKEAQAVAVEAIRTPALFVFNDGDEVVDHARTREIAARWGGPAEIANVEPGPGDTPSKHVIAGDITAPGLTAEVTEILTAWASRPR